MTKRKNPEDLLPMGRPKVQLTDLPDGWEEQCYALARTGASEAALRINGLGKMSTDLFYRLIDEEPHFSEAIKRCQDLALIYWEEMGEKLATGNIEKGNATAWIFTVKNRFRRAYGDVQRLELTGKDGKPIAITDRTERVSRLAFLFGQHNPSGS